MPTTKPLTLCALALLAFAGCTDDPGTLDDDSGETAGSEDEVGEDGSTDGSGTDEAGTDDGTGSTGGETTGEETTGGETTGGQPSDCPVDQFVDPQPDPNNGAYADPFLNVYCENDELVVESNGIPHYEFVQLTPNPLGAQDYEWRIPQFPEVAAQTTEVPLLGLEAFSVSGLPIFGPNEGPFPDPFGDPVYNDIVDFCLGHTAMEGVYHLHAMVTECFKMDPGPNQPSPIIGYALDGFPIYGPRGCLDADCSEVVEFQSGWVQTGDPTTYAWDNHEYQPSDDPSVLDECNGRYDANGNYGYHATATFPYVLGCYRGTPQGVGMGGPP